LTESLEDKAVRLIRTAAIQLPDDVKDALKKACSREESENGKLTLEALLKSVDLSEQEGTPICQDTGSIVFYVRGACPMRGLEEALSKATARATVEVPLRANMVDPFTGENTGDNLGQFSPFFIWESNPHRNSVELTVVLKGAGSDNQTTLSMLNPTEGIDAIENLVLNRVVEAGGKSCPPTIIGIGIGGSSDVAVLLSKKALLRRIGSRNPNPRVAELERYLLERVNSTGIGPMGLGGTTTSLGVNVGWAHRHIASLPVAVTMSCWALRRASITLSGSDISETKKAGDGRR